MFEKRSDEMLKVEIDIVKEVDAKSSKEINDLTVIVEQVLHC